MTPPRLWAKENFMEKHSKAIILLAFILVSLLSCKQEEAPIVKPEEPKKAHSLSWENNYPTRKEWSKIIYSEVEGRFESFDKASDMSLFCPKYKSLDKDKKIAAISQMIVGVAYHESGWKATSWMTESTMGKDCITGVQIKSEGLLQLSYCDMTWAKHCKFDWAKDKSLDQNDSKKTIFDPYLNLSCGIGILANQIDKYGKIVMAKNIYWAVLKDPSVGKYSKVNQIADSTKKALEFCN